MDRRIFDMLELYRQTNHNNENKPVSKECFNGNFCLETDYNAVNSNILTMAFVNMQPCDSVYETEDGFKRGTIFPNIDKPFYGGKKYE